MITSAFTTNSDFASSEINVVKNKSEKSVKIMNAIKVNAEDVTQKNANISSSTKDVNCQNPNLTTTQPQPKLNLVGFDTMITLHKPHHHPPQEL